MPASPDNPKLVLYKHAVAGSQRINLWRPVGLSDMVAELHRRSSSSNIFIQPDSERFVLPSLVDFRTTDIISDAQVNGINRINGQFEVMVDDAGYVLFRGRILRPQNFGGRNLVADQVFDIMQTEGDEVSPNEFKPKVSELKPTKVVKISDLFTGKWIS